MRFESCKERGKATSNSWEATLAILELRRALLEERAHALAEVLRARREHLVAILHRDRVLPARGVHVELQRPLGEAQRQRRVAQHALRELLRGLVEPLVRHHA